MYSTVPDPGGPGSVLTAPGWTLLHAASIRVAPESTPHAAQVSDQLEQALGEGVRGLIQLWTGLTSHIWPTGTG